MTVETPSTLDTGQSAEVDSRFEQLNEHFGQFGQEHVLRYWHELDTDQQDELAKQLEQVDLAQIEKLFRDFDQPALIPTDAAGFAEPANFALSDANPRFSRDEAIAAGEAVLRAGTIGVVIVAGGQGTRLGFGHPKGMFQIGPLSNASLFEILLTKVLAASRRYGQAIPVYLMTSPATHNETVQFLDQNDRFGLSADELVVFCQGTMPAVDIETGELLLCEKHSLFQSPDGHGGMVSGLDRSGAFEHMRQRSVEHLFYMQVDNALADVAAPDAIGYHILSNADVTTMVIRKEDPTEKVGNVAVLDGKTQIIEYSDLPEKVARLQKEDGSLLLWAGNVAVHVWDVAFLEETAASDTGLPFHYARKKIPHITKDGRAVNPVEPNGIKFERFIFDLLPAARRAIVVEVDRATYFAPLKNPSSAPADTPEAVRSQIADVHRGWLVAAGVYVEDGVTVEIHPTFAATQEELLRRIDSNARFEQDELLI